MLIENRKLFIIAHVPGTPYSIRRSLDVDAFTRFDMKLARDRQTGRRTDTTPQQIPRYTHESRGEKQTQVHRTCSIVFVKKDIVVTVIYARRLSLLPLLLIALRNYCCW